MGRQSSSISEQSVPPQWPTAPAWVPIAAFIVALAAGIGARSVVPDLSTQHLLSGSVVASHVLAVTFLVWFLSDAWAARASLRALDKEWVNRRIAARRMITNPTRIVLDLEEMLYAFQERCSSRWIWMFIFSISISLLGFHAFVTHVRTTTTPVQSAPLELLLVPMAEFLLVSVIIVGGSAWLRRERALAGEQIKAHVNAYYNTGEVAKLINVSDHTIEENLISITPPEPTPPVTGDREDIWGNSSGASKSAPFDPFGNVTGGRPPKSSKASRSDPSA